MAALFLVAFPLFAAAALAHHDGPYSKTRAEDLEDSFPGTGTFGGCSASNIHYCTATGSSPQTRPHALDTDYRHLAYHIAWYLHWQGSGSEEETKVRVITHSMGGVLIRYALAHLGDQDWPSHLPISDIVTLGTPHDGTGLGCFAPPSDKQGRQLCPNSSENNWLYHNAQDPGAWSFGTDWTLIGSECDWVVDHDESAVDMNAAHKVLYLDTDPPGSEPEWCPSHTDDPESPFYGAQNGASNDADVHYRDRPDPWFSWNDAPRALNWSARALGSDAW